MVVVVSDITREPLGELDTVPETQPVPESRARQRLRNELGDLTRVSTEDKVAHHDHIVQISSDLIPPLIGVAFSQAKIRHNPTAPTPPTLKSASCSASSAGLVK